MKLKVSVFEYLNQKVMYVQDVNYYFGIKNDFNIKLGDYELSKDQILAIAKENDPEEYEVFVSTSIEERLNKIKTYDIEEIKEQSSYGQFTLCLHPSRKCNLNCKYCFRESEYLGEQQLTFEVAKDAIDFLVDKYAPCASKYVVDLSGSGEPLLQIDLIKQIVEYCKKKRNKICKNIEVMFCTNLTLLTPEIVEYLDNEPAIILGTSIDGDQITNDNNRVYANGKGTYADIVKGLKMFKNKKLGLAVTITPLNQDVDLIYDCLYHLPNVDCVSMKFIRCYDGSKYDFDNFDISCLISRYDRLCCNVLIELEKGNFEYLKKLLKGGDYFGGFIYGNLFKGTYKIYRCDAGKSRITVNNAGDIFACSVMYGNNDYRIGSIYSGINKESQSKFECVTIESVMQCKNCEIKSVCGGECYVNAYLKNSDFNFTLLSFSGMLEAGKSGGFSANNVNYITALQYIDAYIGEFLQAIDERKNAFYEDWLVVVTSNHGGKEDGSYGGNSAEERNTFGIFYYPHYTEQKMLGKKMYGAYFDSSKAQGIVLDTVSTNIK